MIVSNWKSGWRWFSSWAFLLIVFISTEPLPPELLAVMPEAVQRNLTAIVAALGLVLRFVGQSKGRLDE